MLLERGIDVPYETIRRRTAKLGLQIARNLRRRQEHPGNVWHLDEVVVKISGRKFWLWRVIGPVPLLCLWSAIENKTSFGLRC